MRGAMQWSELESIIDAKRRAAAGLLSRSGVVAVEVGPKVVAGKVTAIVAVRVLVADKHDVADEQVLPSNVEGYPTDVIEIEPLAAPPAENLGEDNLRYDPLVGGIGIGSCIKAGKGTGGAFLADRASGAPLMLTNEHVLQNAPIGSLMTQPPPMNGGSCDPSKTPPDIVGRIRAARRTAELDAATISVDGRQWSGQVQDVGLLAGVLPRTKLAFEQPVRKRGRTSLLTYGQIVALAVSVRSGRLRDGSIEEYDFRVQGAGGPFAQQGDSGSVVVTPANRVCGLLSEGSGDIGVCNAFDRVSDAMNASVVSPGLAMTRFVDWRSLTYHVLVVTSRCDASSRFREARLLDISRTQSTPWSARLLEDAQLPGPVPGSPLVGFDGTNGGPGNCNLLFVAGITTNPRLILWSWGASTPARVDLTEMLRLEAPAPRGLARVSVDGATSEVFFVGTQNRHIYYLREQISSGTRTWTATDLTTATSSPVARIDSPLTAYAWSWKNSLHVAYIGSNHRVYELYNENRGGWHKRDLTAANSNRLAAAASGLASYVWYENSSEHVIYVAADGHLYELYHNQAEEGGWHVRDISKSESNLAAPAPWSSLGGYNWTDNHSQHILYCGTDLSLNEAYREPDSEWHGRRLTDPAHERLMPGATIHGNTLAYNPDEPGQSVWYFSDQQRLNELHYTKNHGWAKVELPPIN